MSRIVALATAALALTGCSVELHHNLAEKDANDIYVLLQENGINASKTKDDTGNEVAFTISVPKQDAPSAYRLLNEYALPRPKVAGLKIFADKKGMIPTQTEERAMFLEAMGGEVSMALHKIDGVLEARTIVMLPEVNDLTKPENKPKNTAAVLVKYRPMNAEGHAPMDEEMIRRFVSSALPDMRPENVSVLLSRALPPAAIATPSGQLKSVFGLPMPASSASTVRVILLAGGLLILALAGYIIFSFMRGGTQPQTPRRPRARPE
jgi:type III secretion protein J